MSSWNRIAFSAAISLGTPSQASSGEGEQLICDVGADYALGIEDYPKAISLHAEVVQSIPATHWLIIIWVLPRE